MGKTTIMVIIKVYGTKHMGNELHVYFLQKNL